ncbi:MAG: class I SAM-dependent methyltransferase [Chitinophagales bacterium]|nr:class I SAM-dependent methyltransferase [Chitinophagales bacterium]
MDYQLLDCGDFYKIERFGAYVLARPEPQALWALKKPLDDWRKEVDAFYERKKEDIKSNKEDSGNWILSSKVPNNWIISLGKFLDQPVQVKLALTSFKHVGIFPEQWDNWNFICQHSRENSLSGNLLNLFAYTGVASLVGNIAGYKVTHVDAVKQVVNWANENREISKLESNISWVVEDAIKYLQREIKRSKKYTAILLDPPAYGRGPNGEKWVLEKELFHLLILCKQVLEENKSFLIINLYSLNITPLLLENILKEVGLWSEASQCMEQFIPYGENKKLPLGVCGRVIFSS